MSIRLFILLEMIVSIPKGLSTKIQVDNQVVKGLVIYYQLKSLYVGGTIHNYRKRYQELADTFGISNSNIRNKISFLKQIGLAESKGAHLFLRSKRLLIEKYNTSKKCYKIDCTINFEAQLKALALHENIEQQKYRIVRKIVDHKLKESKDKPKKYIKSVTRYVRDNFDTIVQKEKERFHESYINPFTTLSRTGIAKTLNRKSKSTGHRWAKKLVNLGLMLESSNLVLFRENSTFEECRMLNKYSKSHYTFKNGNTYLVLANTLRLKVGFEN